MSQVKILIVEDKRIIADSIATVVSQRGIEVMAICDSGEEAIQEVLQHEPDLVVMDIKLSGKMDGIEVAHFINKDRQIPIIYLTDYADQATFNRAKNTFPVNYLTKPFNEGELVRAIDIACNNANSLHRTKTTPLLKKYVFLKDNNSFEKFAYNEILCLKAGRSYCEVITTKRKITFSTSLNHIHEQLDNENFVRVQRSWVVNANKITKLEGNVIYVGEIEVPIGRDYKDDLTSRLKLIK